MTKHTPKISIIIPTFNAAKTLAATLESIINQTFRDFEVLIIDGLSTDDTVMIAKNYTDSRIKIISEKDKGIYDAMNKGIDKAAGEWLYFLGSDDTLFSPTALENIFTKYDLATTKIVYGNVQFKLSKAIYDGKFSYFRLYDKNICHQAIFYRKEVFKQVGNYQLQYKALADWVLNMKCFSLKIPKLYVNEIVAIYNEDGYCFNNPDKQFEADSEKLRKLYFPFGVLFLIRWKTNKYFGKFVSRFVQRIY
jgi:glycosyltransferase involved in cell wall biosynthesis